MSKNKRAVVVGGAGFIGSNLTAGLIADGWTVEVIDNLVAGKKERVHPAATLHILDIRDFHAIAPVIRGADAVFHLAALPRVQYSIDNPQETNEVNIGGTVNVLEAARQGGVRRVVYSASSSAYGDSKEMPLHEELPTAPLSPYGLQKYAGEEYARIYSYLHNIETVSLRYFNVYGPGLNPEGAYALVMGVWLTARKEGRPLPVTGDGEQTRDFTHVSDVVRANILAAKSKNVGKGEVINIGAGNNCSINRLAELFGGKTVHIPGRREPKHTLADNRKAKKLLEWEPHVELEDGVRDLLEWWTKDLPRIAATRDSR